MSVAGGELAIRMHLRVAHGLPIAEVARQVDLAVRHAIRSALGREIDRLSIRVARLELHPGGEPPEPRRASGPRTVRPGRQRDGRRLDGGKLVIAGRA